MKRHRVGDVAAILLGYFEGKNTFQTDQIMTVPAADYFDPDQWRAEMDIVFRHVPLMLALSCEMPRPNDYKAMEVVGVPILMARDDRGKVRAFINTCAHRWAPVTPEGHGNSSRFTCPFHGWTYAADGKLIGVADHLKFGDIDKSSHGLKELPCEERYGMIFVCLSPSAALDLEGYYGGLLEEYADVDFKNWTFLGSGSVEGANWKLSLSNFLESYHFATLHAKTVALELASDVAHYEGFGPNIRIGLAHRSIARLRDVPRARWAEQEGKRVSFIRFFFPNVTSYYVASELECSLFTQTFPGSSSDKSRTVFTLLRKTPLRDDVDRAKIEKEMKATLDIGYNEDLLVGIQIQRGLRSGAHAGLLYGRNERGNQYFHEWLNWYLQRDPTVPQPVM
jgi:phenylpropionate dioxygenase-like ring-hydroxylating dioxygenase large terminal subunit